MLDNNTYNLMMQIVQENKSLWRIRDTYKRDSIGCDKCMAFWEKLERAKEDQIKELHELVKSHITGVK